jgi:hypothetical protein
MNLTRKQNHVLLLALTFSATFLITFLTITFTQSAYSTPASYAFIINGMDIAVGPSPNSTNIPLDTTISVEALASASLNDLHVNPIVHFATVTSETTGPLTYRTTFCPDKPLKTATLYNVSVTIMKVPIQWSFTTTSQPFRPDINYYLATKASWIALIVALTLTTIEISALWFRGKPKRRNIQ